MLPSAQNELLNFVFGSMHNNRQCKKYMIYDKVASAFTILRHSKVVTVVISANTLLYTPRELHNKWTSGKLFPCGLQG